MVKTSLVALSALLFFKTCYAQEVENLDIAPATTQVIDYSWSGGQITKQVILSSEAFIDMNQTIDIKNLQGAHELNPLLGPHPSDSKVKHYFEGSQVVEIGVVHFLPKWRDGLLDAGIVWEACIIGHNKHVGISIRI